MCETFTFADAYALERRIASTCTCPHGRRWDLCGSSQCHIHDPADFADPGDTLDHGELQTFLLHLKTTYMTNPELYHA